MSGAPTSSGRETAARQRLEQVVEGLESVLVAFSGGVDSSLVLKACRERLGDRVAAALGVSPSLPPGEREQARALAHSLGTPLEEIETAELENESYATNPGNRCYFCKQELHRHLAPLAHQRGLRHVADGLHLDDLTDVRPGRQAADEAGVRHPLVEAGLCKADVRVLARDYGLPNWNKPALACLSSRIPHGTRITVPLLARIGAAEGALHALGFEICRVRVHQAVARVEVPEADLPRLLAARAAVIAALKQAGFEHVTLDLEGYRTAGARGTSPLP